MGWPAGYPAPTRMARLMPPLQTHHRIALAAGGLSLVAWAALLGGRGPAEYCAASLSGADAGWLQGAALAEVSTRWLFMLVAMLSPLLIAPLYFVFSRSFARLRLRLAVLCALGYAAVWAAAASVLALGELRLAAAFPPSPWPALAVGAAALLWQASPWKQACLNRCHRYRPLAAFGLAAHRDALRLGLEHGVWCLGSCWLNMLWPMLLPAGHHAAMLAVALLMVCERLDPGAPPMWRLRGCRTAISYATWIWRRWAARQPGNPQPLAP